MVLSDLLMEGDIVYINHGEKAVYLYPSNKKKFIANLNGYKIECEYKDIKRFEHFERSSREVLEYKTKVAMIKLSNEARLNKTVAVIEDTLLDFDEFGYYKVVFEGNRDVFKNKNGCGTSIIHSKIDIDAQLIFATNGYYKWFKS